LRKEPEDCDGEGKEESMNRQYRPGTRSSRKAAAHLMWVFAAAIAILAVWLASIRTPLLADEAEDGGDNPPVDVCDTDGDGLPDSPYTCDHDSTPGADSCYACDLDVNGVARACYQCDHQPSPSTPGVLDGVMDSCFTCDHSATPGTDSCYTCDRDGDSLYDSCYVCDKDGDGVDDHCVVLDRLEVTDCDGDPREAGGTLYVWMGDTLTIRAMPDPAAASLDSSGCQWTWSGAASGSNTSSSVTVDTSTPGSSTYTFSYFGGNCGGDSVTVVVVDVDSVSVPSLGKSSSGATAEARTAFLANDYLDQPGSRTERSVAVLATLSENVDPWTNDYLQCPDPRWTPASGNLPDHISPDRARSSTFHCRDHGSYGITFHGGPSKQMTIAVCGVDLQPDGIAAADEESSPLYVFLNEDFDQALPLTPVPEGHIGCRERDWTDDDFVSAEAAQLTPLPMDMQVYGDSLAKVRFSCTSVNIFAEGAGGGSWILIDQSAEYNVSALSGALRLEGTDIGHAYLSVTLETQDGWTCTDRILVSVVRLDLQAVAPEVTQPAGEEADIHEICAAYELGIGCNDDDSDGDGIADDTDSLVTGGDPDLAEMTVGLEGQSLTSAALNGDITVTCPSSARIFLARDRSVAPPSPQSATFSFSELPATFYVEAASASSALLAESVRAEATLTGGAACNDQVNLTFLKIDGRADSDGSGTIDAGADDAVEESQAVLVPVNRDDDDRNGSPDCTDLRINGDAGEMIDLVIDPPLLAGLPDATVTLSGAPHVRIFKPDGTVVKRAKKDTKLDGAGLRVEPYNLYPELGSSLTLKMEGVYAGREMLLLTITVGTFSHTDRILIQTVDVTDLALDAENNPLRPGMETTITATTSPASRPCSYSIIGDTLGCTLSGNVLRTGERCGTVAVCVSDTEFPCAQKTVEVPVGNCSRCEECAAGTKGQARADSIDLDLPLGRITPEKEAGSLRLKVDRAHPQMYSPVAWLYTGAGTEIGGYAVNSDSDSPAPRQILTDTVLVDIVSDDWLSDGTTIAFYLRSSGNVGGLDPVTGLYTVAGVPDVSWVVSNPDANEDDSDYDTMQVDYYVQGGLSETFLWEYTEISDTQWRWVFSTGRTGPNSWERIEALDTVLSSANTVRTVTRSLYSSAVPAPVFAEEVTYHLFGSLGSHRKEWVQRVLDPGGGALTTTRTFDTAASRLLTVNNPDGSREAWTYDAQGRVASRSTHFKDTPGAHVTYYDYPDATDTRPSSVEVTTGGTTVSLTYHNHTGSSRGPDIETTEIALRQAALPGAADNLTSVREIDAQQRPVYILNPDGTCIGYSYEEGDYDPLTGFTPGTGAYRRVTATHGTASSPAGIANRTERVLTVQDRAGREMYREVQVYTGTGYETLSWTRTERDALGHATRTDYSDGTWSTAVWGCCRKENETDRTGATTYYGYDSLNRLTSVAEPFGRLTEFTFDAAGRKIAETVTGGVTLTLASTAAYDLAGRRIASYDYAGLETEYAYSAGGRIVTVTRPDGGTRITERYLDGRVKSETGTAAVPRHYDYGYNSNGTVWRTVRTGGAASARLETTTYDMAGRLLSREAPAWGGGTQSETLTYDADGRPAARSATGRADRLYEYDAIGTLTRSGLDVDANGALEPSGTDRIEDRDEYYDQAPDGTWWRRSAVSVYTVDNDGTSNVTVSSRRTRLTGLGATSPVYPGILTAEAEITDAAGAVTRTYSFVDRTTFGTRLDVVDVPDSTVDAVTVYQTGLKLAVLEPDTAAAITIAHDGLGRETGRTHPRTGTSTTHYDSAGRVDWVEDAHGARTSYSYSTVTGRLSSIETPLGDFEYRDYDTAGRMTRRWGGAVHPVEYTYDIYGQVHTMDTFRGGTGWSGATWPTGVTGDTTVWTHDTATGLLASKTFADGGSVSYTYDAARRTASRAWTRTSGGTAVTASYTYDSATGELTGVTYSDSTPQVTYEYTRAGQVASVTDAVGERSFTYNSALQPTAEQFPAGWYGTTSSRTMSYDTVGRLSGQDVSVGGVDVSEIAYGYGTYGRLTSVSTPVDSWQYTYETGTVLPKYLDHPNSVRTEWIYDSDRDVLDSVSNTYDPAGINEVRSMYDYTVDDGGRRTAVQLSGTEFPDTGGYTAPYDVSFTHNSRGEVTAAAKADSSVPPVPVTGFDYTYDFDNIGNREVTEAGTGAAMVTRTYTSDSVNAYSAVATALGDPPGTPTVDSPAYDDDGNTLSLSLDGTGWSFTWDGENRLASAESGSRRIEYTYDYKGRRVERRVYTGTPGNWTLSIQERSLWHGWLPAAEFLCSGGSVVLDRVYVWGMDLSGSLEGAGGVGGLLAVIDDSGESAETYYVVYDGNGNVSEYLDDAGDAVAHYEYSPFGVLTAAAGTMADDFRHRFSTKTFEAAGDSALPALYYYGYRYYAPRNGRWLSRDPLGEEGGLLLYGFCGNGPGQFTDPLGQFFLAGLSAIVGGLIVRDRIHALSDWWYKHRLDQINAADPNIDMQVEADLSRREGPRAGAVGSGNIFRKAGPEVSALIELVPGTSYKAGEIIGLASPQMGTRFPARFSTSKNHADAFAETMVGLGYSDIMDRRVGRYLARRCQTSKHLPSPTQLNKMIREIICSEELQKTLSVSTETVKRLQELVLKLEGMALEKTKDE
jgi:RHS repeat-associated protein